MINNTFGMFPLKERVIVDYSVQPIPENPIDSSFDDSDISNQAIYSSEDED